MPPLAPPVRLALLCVVAAVAGCGTPPPPVPPPPPPPSPAFAPPVVEGPPWFEEVTAASGVQFTYRNGEEANELAVIESLGGGVGVIDYDRDGRPDLFFPGGGFFENRTVRGHPPKLFRNLGGFRFADVTAEAGLAGAAFYSHGAAVADYDRDGWPDLAVTGWGPVALYHNEPDGKGGRRFAAVGPAAGFTEPLWSCGAAWADLDGDGWPDLYACQYGNWSFDKNNPTDCFYTPPTRDICPPRRFEPLPHRLYRNNKDGTFTDVSEAVKLRADGRGIGVIAVDLNLDQKPDLYAANDTDDNFLYLNRTAGGHLALEEKGYPAGVAGDDGGKPNGSMGVDAADYDRTGRPSVFVTNYERELHALYRNTGGPDHDLFTFATRTSGLATLGTNWVGWGTGFADFDRDGWEDLFIAHGHAIRFPRAGAPRRQHPALFRNEAGQFANVTFLGGTYCREPHNARGAALVDLDGDGRIDLVVSHLNEPAVVLRNVCPGTGRWVGIELLGAGHRDVAGARVVVTAGGKKIVRFAKGGGSHASSGDRRLVFGLGTEERIEAVEVYWPWQGSHTVTGIVPGNYWRVTEGQVRADPLPATE